MLAIKSIFNNILLIRIWFMKIIMVLIAGILGGLVNSLGVWIFGVIGNKPGSWLQNGTSLNCIMADAQAD
jgi:hypothetical protein